MNNDGQANDRIAPTTSDPDDLSSNPSTEPTLWQVWERRQDRRTALKSAALLAGALAAPRADAAKSSSTLTFPELQRVRDERHHVADGYRADVVIRWGDPVLDAPAFDPAHPSAEAQALQFGYNNDFLAFFPLPAGSNQSDHGLLWVNHEYTNPELMVPGFEVGRWKDVMTPERTAIELAAHGGSVIEIVRQGGRWTVVPSSRYRRRLTLSTPMSLSGPAAGHPRLRTQADPTGAKALGTLNNCAGGVTPWGTVLTCEENFNLYFSGKVVDLSQEKCYARYGVGSTCRHPWWGRDIDRFNLSREPNECNRFGWVVEIDPHDPDSTPIKRTALGRMKHEGAAVVVNGDGRLAIYMGDDQANDYIYKYVSEEAWKEGDRNPGRLLDEGTLYVARLEADGRLKWLPLVFGSGPLTPTNGFANQGDVLVETRRAADLLGATPLDRPEDIEVHPTSGRVYAMLSNNILRKAEEPGSPVAPNRFGHILEILPETTGGRANHAAEIARWDILLRGGDPRQPSHSALVHAQTTSNGWLSGPDNAVFDARGRLWIATDEAEKYAGIANSVYACDVEGSGRGLPRLFFAAPEGAEICGPCLTPDQKTMFLAIQHPGEGPKSTYEAPTTRWPDFIADRPPRPSVIAITRIDGGVIGD